MIVFIVVPIAVIFAGLVLLLGAAWWRFQHNRRHEGPAPNAVVGMDAIMPELGRSSTRFLSPSIERAHKFRERARTTVIGKPEFKVHYKNQPSKTDLFDRIEEHNAQDVAHESKTENEIAVSRNLNYILDSLEGQKYITDDLNEEDEHEEEDKSKQRKISEDITHTTVNEFLERGSSMQSLHGQLPSKQGSSKNLGSLYIRHSSSNVMSEAH